MLAGSEPLQRSIPDGLPGTASTDMLIPVSSRDYDGFGNLTQELAPNGRCRTISYDGAFGHLPIEESIATGGDPAAGFEPANCTTRTLVTQASYDRSFELVAQATDMQGQPTVIAYDDFGRLASLHRPNPHGPGLSPEPSVQVAYFLPGHPALGPNARHSIIHTQAQDGEDVSDGLSYLESWTYVDGLGRTIVTLNEADPTTGPGQGNDDGARIASGLVDYDNKSAVRRKFLEFFTDADPLAFNFAAQPGSPYGRQRYDAFGRQLQTFDLDGTVTLQSRYHALSTDLSDAADLQPSPHQGTFASERRDGHGRTVAVTERFDDDGGMEQRVVRTKYLHTNEPEVITRERLDSAGLPKGDPPVIRWLRYDSVGRMVLNVEPNTSGTTFDPDHTLADTSGITAWRYAYNDFGDLVGTSDARGCGVTYEYDGAGRLLIEDYSPCEPTHAPYSDPEPASRTGIEVLYHYDELPTHASQPVPFGPSNPDPEGRIDVSFTPQFLSGRLVAVWDRGSNTFTSYDGRGRVAQTAVRIAKPLAPGSAENDLATRYTPRWYQRDFEYDAADRETLATTGATDTDLVGAAVTGQDGVTTYSSAVTTTYSRRGTVSSVNGSYSSLVASVDRDGDGLLNTLAYGDLATTTTGFAYDNRRRLRSVQTYRAAPSAWSDPSYPAPGPSDDPSQQLLLQDEDFEYDVVNNPTEIRDWRDPSEWPDGAKPVTKKIQYDDLYRVSRVDYEHAPGDDTWTSPYARENAEAAGAATPDPRRAQPSPHVDFSHRIRWQTFDYDWLGNNVVTDDDAHGFYDRSIGNIGNGTASQGPYQLTGANNAAQAGPGDSEGELETRYDPAGNLKAMKVRRAGACLPMGALCSQRFDYRWDEVGRLVRAQRWDIAEADYASEDLDGPVPAGLPAADLRYEYDAGDQRVTKQAVDDVGSDRFTLYIFESLELRRAPFASGDYELSADTEVPYLFANGVRLARVVFEDSGVPSIGGSTRHVFFELGDHLGSTSVVLDQETGELVERATFQAYGAPETDYRPERWEAFREDYRFTGKEEDVEVGLQYFGARFLVPRLGRWASADPLTVHGLGADENAYAYVRGAALRAVDPLGLQSTEGAGGTAGEASGGSEGAGGTSQQDNSASSSSADPPSSGCWENMSCNRSEGSGGQPPVLAPGTMGPQPGLPTPQPGPLPPPVTGVPPGRSAPKASTTPRSGTPTGLGPAARVLSVFGAFITGYTVGAFIAPYVIPPDVGVEADKAKVEADLRRFNAERRASPTPGTGAGAAPGPSAAPGTSGGGAGQPPDAGGGDGGHPDAGRKARRPPTPRDLARMRGAELVKQYKAEGLGTHAGRSGGHGVPHKRAGAELIREANKLPRNDPLRAALKVEGRRLIREGRGYSHR